MKGLELSRLYYTDVIQPFIREQFPEYENRIAVGMVGEGSECYGYDDDFSRDHDWGAKVCLWLNPSDYDFIGRTLQGANDADMIKTTVINGYVFQIHPFPMNYVHGMVEMYHWITIGLAGETPNNRSALLVEPLTKREKKVAELLCQGLSYQAIAEEMFISFHTVKNHVQNIFAKYGVNSRYQFYQIYKE